MDAATNSPPAFRLMDLPCEIRIKVLELTVIVAPSCCDLIFQSGRRYFNYRLNHKRTDKGCLLPNHYCIFSTVLFGTCRQLSLEAREVYLSRNKLIFPNFGRQLPLEAREVYLSCNKLMFPGHWAKMQRPELGSQDIAMAMIDKYLRSQPQYLLKKIRTIGFFIPSCDHMLEDNQALRPTRYFSSFSAKLDFVMQNLNLPNLTLRICLGPTTAIEWMSSELWYTRKHVIHNLRPNNAGILVPLFDLKERGLKELEIWWPTSDWTVEYRGSRSKSWFQEAERIKQRIVSFETKDINEDIGG